MASKKQLVPLEIQTIQELPIITSGFIGFGAKSDGLYMKLPDGNEYKLYSLKDGNVLLSGTSAPSDSIGRTGDFYIDSQYWNIYGPKTTVWGTPTSIKGIDGAPGNRWYSDDTLPDPTLYNDGDFFLISNGNVYQKLGATWVLKTNIKGDDGIDGIGTAESVGALVNSLNEKTELAESDLLSFRDEINGLWEKISFLNVVQSIRNIFDNEYESKNQVVVNYYVTNITEFISAWNDAQTKSLPSKIYASGDMNFSSNVTLSGTKQIQIEGVPFVNFKFNGYSFSLYSPSIKNAVFFSPNSSGYIKSLNGGASLDYAIFRGDTHSGNSYIPHIVLNGSFTNSTGNVRLNDIYHSTSDPSINIDPTKSIQPIYIKDNSGVSGNRLSVSIKNIDHSSSFDRFANILITTSIGVILNVTGDTSWKYHSIQKTPGNGLHIDSNIYPVASIHDMRLNDIASSTLETSDNVLVERDGKAYLIPQSEFGEGGSSILSGNGAPALTLGSNGSFYIDKENLKLYGPKTNGDWGVPINMRIDVVDSSAPIGTITPWVGEVYNIPEGFVLLDGKTIYKEGDYALTSEYEVIQDLTTTDENRYLIGRTGVDGTFYTPSKNDKLVTPLGTSMPVKFGKIQSGSGTLTYTVYDLIIPKSETTLTVGDIITITKPRKTFPKLFEFFGSTDTSYILPDLSGKFLAGFDPANLSHDKIGETGGASVVVLTSEQSGLPAHDVGSRTLSSTGTEAGYEGIVPKNSTTNLLSLSGFDAAEAHENKPPYYTVGYIMKGDYDIDTTGKTAYDVYLQTVPEGETPLTKQEWLDSLKGGGKIIEQDTVPTNPEEGMRWLDTSTGILYEYVVNNWVELGPQVASGGIEIISLSYSELYALTQTSGLTVGQRYIINDYQTIYTQPVSNELLYGSTEPLMVEALTVNKLKNECYSALFPQDIVYYDIENNQSMVPGCLKGYIYRRVDTLKNNDIGFDYRNVKFRRWQLNVTVESVDGNEVFTKNSVVKKTDSDDVYIKLSDEQGTFDEINKWKRYDFNNLMYIIPQDNDWEINGIVFPNSGLYFDYHMFSTEPTMDGIECVYDNINYNKIKVNSTDIITNSNSVFFGGSFKYNTIGPVFHGNTIGDYFEDNNTNEGFGNNIIGTSFYKNIIGGGFYGNNIGYNFYYNTIGDGFSYNIIGGGFYSNNIEYGFQYNNIGGAFYDNTIGVDFYGNTIGDGFRYNIIGKAFYENTVGVDFYGNTIGDGFSYNIIGGGFYGNNIGYNFYYNNIGESFSNNTIGDGFSYNIIGVDFYRNTIGYYSAFNTIGERFDNNTIGTYFQHNTIGSSFSKNKVGNDFYVNTIDQNFQSNTIDDNFNNNTIGFDFNNNTIGNDFYKNTIGDYFNNNLVSKSFNKYPNDNGVDFTLSTYVYLDFPKTLFINSNHAPYLNYYDENNTLIIVPANA